MKWFWATGSRWPWWSRRVGQDNSQRLLPTATTLWFYDLLFLWRMKYTHIASLKDQRTQTLWTILWSILRTAKTQAYMFGRIFITLHKGVMQQSYLESRIAVTQNTSLQKLLPKPLLRSTFNEYPIQIKYKRLEFWLFLSSMYVKAHSNNAVMKKKHKIFFCQPSKCWNTWLLHSTQWAEPLA